jgi:hypothetical protein
MGYFVGVYQKDSEQVNGTIMLVFDVSVRITDEQAAKYSEAVAYPISRWD